jgi:hypothetical protein
VVAVIPEEARVTKATFMAVGLALLVIWLLGFVVFKVAGFLIHLLLIAAAVVLIIGLVRRVTPGARRNP